MKLVTLEWWYPPFNEPVAVGSCPLYNLRMYIYISDYIPCFSVYHSLYYKHKRRLKIPFTSLSLWCYKVKLYSRSISLTNYLTTTQCWTYWFSFVKQHWMLSALWWVTSLIMWGFCCSALYSCLFCEGFHRVSPVGHWTERARRCQLSAAHLVICGLL